jgi:hypothetical protein
MHRLRCGHLNTRYTEHAETWNHSLTPYFHIIWCFLVRLMLQPLYPFTYLCTSWIENFSVDCTVPFTHRLFFNAIQRSLSFEWGTWPPARREFHCEASFTPQSILLHDVYMCYGLLHIRIFLQCIQLSTPSLAVTWSCERWWQTPDAVWSQNSDVIRDVLPGHITAKRD